MLKTSSNPADINQFESHTGNKQRVRGQWAVYKVLFLIFVVIGSSISLGAVIDFSDAMIFAMVVPNIIGVVILSPVISKELKKDLAFLKLKVNEETFEALIKVLLENYLKPLAIFP